MKPRLYLAPWLVLLGAPMHTVAQVPPGDLGQKAKVEREMVAFDPDYRKSIRAREAEALSLAAQVRANEARGRKTSCSHQIMNETLWMLGHTADFARIDGRLRDLKASIASPERESIAHEQAEYNNQSSPATFYSVSAAQTPGDATINGLTPAFGNAGTVVTIAGSGFGATQ